MSDKLNLIRIRKAEHPSLPLLLRLYTEVFPLKERRHPEELISLLDEERMYFLEIVEAEQLLGFVIFREFDQFSFVEHFAIFPQYRGRETGSRVLQQLKETSRPLLLEVEPPTDDINRRRIAFYQRNGFHILELPYFQPPYHPGHSPIPMLLMSDKPKWVKEKLKLTVSSIHKTVYGVGE